MTKKTLYKLHALIDAFHDSVLLLTDTESHADALVAFVDDYGKAQRREGRRDALGRTPRKATSAGRAAVEREVK